VRVAVQVHHAPAQIGFLRVRGDEATFGREASGPSAWRRGGWGRCGWCFRVEAQRLAARSTRPRLAAIVLLVIVCATATTHAWRLHVDTDDGHAVESPILLVGRVRRRVGC